MKCSELCLVAAFGAIAACGGANAGPLGPAEDGGMGGAGGAAGTGGAPPVEQAVFRLDCEYATLELTLPIELVVELTGSFTHQSSTEATFRATVILDEASVASLVGEGITVIDIASVSVTTNVDGATPATMTASLPGVPIDNFDLQTDPDDNGMFGPHRLELDPVTATASAAPGATEVVFGLGFGGISLALGDFSIPSNCMDPSLRGSSINFPVSR